MTASEILQREISLIDDEIETLLGRSVYLEGSTMIDVREAISRLDAMKEARTELLAALQKIQE